MYLNNKKKRNFQGSSYTFSLKINIKLIKCTPPLLLPGDKGRGLQIKIEFREHVEELTLRDRGLKS